VNKSGYKSGRPSSAGLTARFSVKIEKDVRGNKRMRFLSIIKVLDTEKTAVIMPNKKIYINFRQNVFLPFWATPSTSMLNPILQRKL